MKIRKWFGWLSFPILLVIMARVVVVTQRVVDEGLAAADEGLLDVARAHFNSIIDYTFFMLFVSLLAVVAFRFFMDNIEEVLRRSKNPEEG